MSFLNKIVESFKESVAIMTDVNGNIPSKCKTLVGATIGSALYAIGITAFIIPHHLLAGGITGFVIISYYFTNISPGVLNILFNIPILLAAYYWLGRWMVIIAVYGAITSSFFLDQFMYLSTYQLTQSPFVGATMGGIICGIGSGITYRVGANGGGMDPVGQIVRKYWGLQIASVLFMINIAILVLSALIYNIDLAVITLLFMYISVVITNKVVLGLQHQKSAFIVSYNTDAITEGILSQLGRGATILYGEGAYTHESKKVIMAVIGIMQVVKLKNVVYQIDPHAFILISDAAEVTGGFIRPKNRLPREVIKALREKEARIAKRNSVIDDLNTKSL